MSVALMKFHINRETSGLPAKEERDIYSLLYSLVFFPLKETVVKGKNTVNEKRKESPSFEKLDIYIKCMHTEAKGLLTRQMELKRCLCLVSPQKQILRFRFDLSRQMVMQLL